MTRGRKIKLYSSLGLLALIAVFFIGEGLRYKLNAEPLTPDEIVKQALDMDKVQVDEAQMDKAEPDEAQGNVDIEDVSMKVEPIEITLSPKDLREHDDDSKSTFSKSYKLLAEVELEHKNQRVEIKLDEPLDNVISVVIIGGAGEIEHQLSKVEVDGKALPEDADPLKGIYFEDDWQKLELKGNKFTSLSFSGSALGEAGKIKVYLQHQGEIE